ncbi:Cytochrome P450 107B1 [Nocardia otitidiscaviarum]|uniref:Cytochrome P450 107B1 n=1 Tax=Nocardia otitidiscaviarum TaxID=1823 RepID=A0A378YVV3_9NOCA|nr:cytochrome P450 [Nocardia otitidiscaviarum]SUA81316.1 Cytochrome P450 107B1 [Nocardia otitidiscaviarum]
MTAAPERPTPVCDFPVAQPEALQVETVFAALRSRSPIVRVRLPFEGCAWLLTRYRDIRAVFASPDCRREASTDPATPRILPRAGAEGLLMSLDAPEHARLRGVVASWFTARRVEALRPATHRAARALIAEMRTAGRAELVGQFAQPLSAIVIGDLLGVPRADRSRFRGWSETMLSATAATPEQVESAARELGDYFDHLVDERVERPRDDLIGAMVAGAQAGRLTRGEVVALATDLLVAGFETTSAQLTNSVYTVATRPDSWRWLADDPNRIAPAVEELLRVLPLGAGGFRARVTAAPITLGSDTAAPVTIATGEVVIAPTIAANTDPTVFADPLAVRLDRERNRHLTFGHGAHHCLGAQLARMELTVALTELVSAFPDLRLAIPERDLRWRSGMQVRGPHALPLTW